MSVDRIASGLGPVRTLGSLRRIFLEFQGKPLPTFLEATADIEAARCILGLEDAVRSIRDKAVDAKQFGDLKDSSLPVDFIAAIMLYTAEETEPPLYQDMNAKCYVADRTVIKPYSKFMWLLAHALNAVEPYAGRMVHRGVKLNLLADYPKGRTVTWYGMSSTTVELDVLQSDQFLGKSGPRTIFNIELTKHHAREVTRFSLVQEEKEVLLPSGSRFQVTGVLDQGELAVISLREVDSDDLLLRSSTPGASGAAAAPSAAIAAATTAAATASAGAAPSAAVIAATATAAAAAATTSAGAAASAAASAAKAEEEAEKRRQQEQEQRRHKVERLHKEMARRHHQLREVEEYFCRRRQREMEMRARELQQREANPRELLAMEEAMMRERSRHDQERRQLEEQLRHIQQQLRMID